MEPQGRTRLTRLLWRVNVWLDIHPLAAYAFVVLALAFSLWRIESNIDDTQTALTATEQEREDRLKVAGQIIEQGCRADNQQDKLLAQLLEVSLDPPPFGAGIPREKLTAFDKQVLVTITRVQNLSLQLAKQAGKDKGKAEGEENPQAVFKDKLAELNDLRPCNAITLAYLKGEPPKQK